MPRLLFPLLLLAALLGAAPAAATHEAATGGADPPGAKAVGELWRDGALLRYVQGGEVCWEREANGAVPYKIVAEGPLPIAVSMEGLRTVSWAAGAVPQAYPDMLPQAVAPPLYALSELSPTAIYDLPRTVLLAADGSAVVDAAHSELILPYACSSADGCRSEAFLAGQSSDADALYPFGTAPYFEQYSLPTGRLAWRHEFTVQGPVADIELLARSEDRLLFFLLYDYEFGELVLFDVGAQRAVASHLLPGQMASNLVYPGPAEEPAELTLNGSLFEMLVIISASGFESWSIDLESGSLSRVPEGIPSSRLREENLQPVGGSGAPGPGRAAFPQRLLPEQAGEQWRIPALCDASGRVFVVDEQGGHWI